MNPIDDIEKLYGKTLVLIVYDTIESLEKEEFTVCELVQIIGLGLDEREQSKLYNRIMNSIQPFVVLEKLTVDKRLGNRNTGIYYYRKVYHE